MSAIDILRVPLPNVVRTRNSDADRQESPTLASPVGTLSAGNDKLPPILESAAKSSKLKPSKHHPANPMGDGSQHSEPTGIPLSPRSFYGENGHSGRLPSSASAQSAPDFASWNHNTHPESRTRTRSWMDAPAVDTDNVMPDVNGAGPSPNQSRQFEFQPRPHRGSFRSNASNENRAAVPAVVDGPSPDLLQRAPTEDCRYRFLDPVLPYIRNIIPASVACELLDIFLTDPGSSLFRGASPYILTRVFRKKSVLHPTAPRYATPALLATILWCVAQTADVMLLHVPGTRAKVVNDLYDLATTLISERDPDRWRRIHGMWSEFRVNVSLTFAGGLRAENETPIPGWNEAAVPTTTAANEPAGGVDDILTFILLSIAVSGGDFKSDSFKWWSKAVRLTLALRLNREDERCMAPVSPCANPLCSCHRDRSDVTLEDFERREERRRVFWLLYSLDRHLSLSFNTALSMPDSYCEVYCESSFCSQEETY